MLNQEKALVGAFSVIVQPIVEPMEHYTALVVVQLQRVLEDVHRAGGETVAGPQRDEEPQQQVERLQDVDLRVRRGGGRQDTAQDGDAVVNIGTSQDHQDHSCQGVIRKLRELLLNDQLAHLMSEYNKIFIDLCEPLPLTYLL